MAGSPAETGIRAVEPEQVQDLEQVQELTPELGLMVLAAQMMQIRHQMINYRKLPMA